MASTALRPRSASEIVDAAFQILRAHYGQFVTCSALAYFPWLVIELFFMGDPEKWMDASWWLLGGGLIGLALTSALMSSVIISCASQAYLGEPVDVAYAVRRAVPRLPRVLFGAVIRYFLLMLGFFALVIGSLYVFARLFALTPAIILEDASVSTAFARTSALSKRRKSHILNTLGLVAIIYWVIAIGVSVLSAMSGNFVVQAVIGTFYTILAGPIVAITETLLYYDARIQSEGLDIELMAIELGIAPPTEPAAS
jgi:hypothetical protein